MKASKFLRNFYGIPKGKKKQTDKPKKKFSWSNFYKRTKFIMWICVSFIAVAVATALFASVNDIVFFFTLFLLFTSIYIGYCSRKHDKNDSCYQNEAIFFIWAFLTFAIYIGCCSLFVKQDLVPLHITGTIIGTIVGIIFTLCLPPISYVLRLTSDDEEVSDEEKKEMGGKKTNFPTPKDRKMHGWLILIVTIALAIISVLILLHDNKDLKDKRQEVQLEQMAFKDITNKTFIVKDDNLFGDDVYAIIETSNEIVAVKVIDYPEVCDASKVKVLVNGTVIINRREYQDFTKISFETPAPK